MRVSPERSHDQASRDQTRSGISDRSASSSNSSYSPQVTPKSVLQLGRSPLNSVEETQRPPPPSKEAVAGMIGGTILKRPNIPDKSPPAPRRLKSRWFLFSFLDRLKKAVRMRKLREEIRKLSMEIALTRHPSRAQCLRLQQLHAQLSAMQYEESMPAV